jgi:hypothetical protein
VDCLSIPCLSSSTAKAYALLFIDRKHLTVFDLQGEGQLCILAEDCNQPDYKKLISLLY